MTQQPPDIVDQIRAWSLAGLFAALSLFTTMLAGGTYQLRNILFDAGHAQGWVYALIAAAIAAALLCAGAAVRGASAAYRNGPLPAPPWTTLAVVAAVMVIASALYEGL